MSDLDFLETLKMFDIFIELLQNETISDQTNVNNVSKAFECACFIENTIAKVFEIGKESVFENRLHHYWSEDHKSNLYNCADLKNACDILLEVYLKDSNISTDVVDEFLKLYVQKCGSERLNNFLRRIVLTGICTNMIIESLGGLGVSPSEIEDEALIISWEASVGSGNQYEVSKSICKMSDDGHLAKLIRFAVDLHNNNEVKKLIIRFLIDKLAENNVEVTLALIDVQRKSILRLLQNDSEFSLNFVDTIFYFARHMKSLNNEWVSNFELKYQHLLKIIKVLTNGPHEISKTVYDRIQLVKTQSNGRIWCDIERDAGIGWP